MEHPLHIYNNLSGKKEVFTPLNSPYVGLYVCGPTVYKSVHIGNVRTFMSFDVVFRYLSFLGYKVRYVRNITDVGHLTDDEAGTGEDKVAKQARLENLEPMEIVKNVTEDFHAVTRMFNFRIPSIEPTATGHIMEQITMVEKIIEEGYGYEANGSVYFDVEKYHADGHNYGQLSGRKIEDLISNTRELDGQEEKRNPLDFAIWKKAEKGHIMHWKSPWGEGFPGWHLECSAMSTKYLGEQFDIHGGGMDLKFPHHECEIAQNVASTGKNPVSFWMHGNMLTVNKVKMAKSAGNDFSPWQLVSGDHPALDQGYSPMTVRFFMLQTHYASTLDFSNEALQAAEKGFKRLCAGLETLEQVVPSDQSSFDVAGLMQRCADAMNDDFNTSILLSHLFDGVRIINSVKDGTEQLTAGDITTLKQMYKDYFFEILGLENEEESNAGGNELVDGLMQLVIDLRGMARTNKDWATSDKIRDELGALNVSLKDNKEGTSWSVEG